MSIIVNNTDNQLNINNNGVLDVYAVKSIKSVSRGVDASGNYYIAINFIANDKNNSLRIYLKDVSSPVTWANDLAGANAALADIRDWLGEIIEVDINEANDSILVYGYDAAGGNNEAISVDANGQVDTNVHDGSGVAITSTTVGPDTGLDVNIIGGVTLSVNLDAADDEVSIYGSNGGTPTAVAVNASGHVAIQDGGNSITVDGGTGLLRTTGMIRPTGSGNVNTAAPSGFYSVSVANVGSANGTVLSSITIKPGEVLNFSADAINNYFNSFAYNATGTEFIIIYVA
jgi:hypothetical protein